MNIQIIRISTGEWIIGDVEVNSGFTVRSPRVLVIGQNGQGMLVPYAPFANGDEVYFDDADVLHVLKPAPGISDAYRQQLSGIVTATTAPIRETIRRNGLKMD